MSAVMSILGRLVDHSSSHGKLAGWFLGFFLWFIVAGLGYAVIASPFFLLLGAGLPVVLGGAAGCGIGTGLVCAFITSANS